MNDLISNSKKSVSQIVQFVDSLDSFEEPHLAIELKKWVSQYTTPKEGWEVLKTVFACGSLPVSKYMFVAKYDGCIKRLQQYWDYLESLQ
ncbi:hypothetical protein [Stenotrophomonas phage RAS14]